MKKLACAFDRFARCVSYLCGTAGAFVAALLCVLGWAALGPVFGFSDTWQLVINTSTTIVTFLMVFVIQATQNRDTEAMQLKLDELLRANRNAEDRWRRIEKLPRQELDRMRREEP